MSNEGYMFTYSISSCQGFEIVSIVNYSEKITDNCKFAGSLPRLQLQI